MSIAGILTETLFGQLTFSHATGPLLSLSLSLALALLSLVLSLDGSELGSAELDQ